MATDFESHSHGLDELPLLIALVAVSCSGAHATLPTGFSTRWTENEQTRVGVLLELGDSNRILAKEFLNCRTREVAPIDMNQLGCRTSLADHRYEIGIRSHHGVAILPRPIPDRPIIRLLEANITHMGQAEENSDVRRGMSRKTRGSRREAGSNQIRPAPGIGGELIDSREISPSRDPGCSSRILLLSHPGP